MSNARKEREIGSEPSKGNEIAREVEHDQTHPWAKQAQAGKGVR